MTFQLIWTMTGVPPSLWGTLSCDSQDRAGKYKKVETRNNLRVLAYNLFLWAPDGLGDSASSSLEFYLSLFLSYVKVSFLVDLSWFRWFSLREHGFLSPSTRGSWVFIQREILSQGTSLLYLVSIRQSYVLCSDYFLNPSLKSALLLTFEFEHIP